MTRPEALKASVLDQCYEFLARAGFDRFNRHSADMRLTENVYCWVGLNTKLTSEYVQINPFVGVHFRDIEQMWTSLKVGKFISKYDRSVATYSVHMGRLAPQEPVYRFYESTDVKAEAVRLSALYSTVGLEYAKSISTYETLVSHLVDRSPTLGGYPERAACCLYMMGRFTEAAEFARRFLETRWDYFEGFAVPFLQLPEIRSLAH